MEANDAMEESNSITYTIAIPEDLLPEIEEYVESHKDQGSFEYQKLPPKPRGAADPLAFDPVLTALGLIALKFVGAKALDLALGVLGAVITAKLKDRWKKEGPRELDLYLSTGEKVSLKLHEEPDRKELAEKLREST
jgi:hypothetical protein